MSTRLEQKFQQLCNIPSDIHEHLPTLARYASECEHVTEAGVRYVVSTFALMMGRPRRLVSIDIVHPNKMYGGPENIIKGKDEFALAQECARENGIDFEFILGDTLQLHIEPTDLLFLDTLHQYNQLRQELARHHVNVRKYIILHDTYSFGHRDEGQDPMNLHDGKPKGLQQAIREFLRDHGDDWCIYREFRNNNGLTIFKRVERPPVHIESLHLDRRFSRS